MKELRLEVDLSDANLPEDEQDMHEKELVIEIARYAAEAINAWADEHVPNDHVSLDVEAGQRP